MWVSRRRQSCCSSYCSNGLSPAAMGCHCQTMQEIFAPHIRYLPSCSRLSHRQMQKNVDGNTFRNFLSSNILKWSDSGSFKHFLQNISTKTEKEFLEQTYLLNRFNHWSNLVIGVKGLKVERRSSVVGLAVSVWSSHHQGGFVHCDDKFVKSQISNMEKRLA